MIARFWAAQMQERIAQLEERIKRLEEQIKQQQEPKRPGRPRKEQQ